MKLKEVDEILEIFIDRITALEELAIFYQDDTFQRIHHESKSTMLKNLLIDITVEE